MKKLLFIGLFIAVVSTVLHETADHDLLNAAAGFPATPYDRCMASFEGSSAEDTCKYLKN